MIVEKYYNEDKTAIGVLVSPGFGAGWSTWLYNKEVAIDKRIIEAWADGASSDEMETLLKEWGYGDVYIGGYYDLILKWVPVGERYYIYEYDGAETLIREENMEIA